MLNLIKKVKKIVINFTNGLFNHFFIIISKLLFNCFNSANITCKINNTNLFAYITTNQYLSNKFYKIIIDINIIKYFIASYKQFITYTKDIKYMTINIFKVNAICI